MTIAEKVTRSANSALFTLYKEGLFYKCYNEDAMLFVKKVRAFKVSDKFVKSFELKNELVIYCLNNSECKQGYKEWAEIQHKNELLVREPAPIYSNANNSAHILTMIRNYDLANSTPMQGLGFIQELKLEVQRIDKSNGNI